jgi:hypothetical protein
VPPGRRFPREAGGHRPAATDQPPAQGALRHQRPHGFGQTLGIGGRHEEGVLVVGQVLAENRDVGGDHREAGAHRLQDSQAPPLLERGEHQCVGRPVPVGQLIVGDRAQEDYVAAELEAHTGKARQGRLAVGGVILERVPAGHDQHGAGLAPPLDLGQGPEEVDAPLAGLDAADGQEQEAPLVGADPPPEGESTLGVERPVPAAVGPVVDDIGVDPVLLAQDFLPVLADNQDPVRVENRQALTVDQGRRGEVVDVVHGAQDRDAGPRPHPHGGPRRDAVLGVHEIEAAGHPPQAGGQGVDRLEHALLEGGRIRW